MKSLANRIQKPPYNILIGILLPSNVVLFFCLVYVSISQSYDLGKMSSRVSTMAQRQTDLIDYHESTSERIEKRIDALIHRVEVLRERTEKFNDQLAQVSISKFSFILNYYEQIYWDEIKKHVRRGNIKIGYKQFSSRNPESIDFNVSIDRYPIEIIYIRVLSREGAYLETISRFEIYEKELSEYIRGLEKDRENQAGWSFIKVKMEELKENYRNLSKLLRQCNR